MKYSVYLKSGEVKQAETQVQDLGNGYDKYTLLYDGQRVQGGVVKSGKVESQVKAWFSRNMAFSVECIFAD